MASSWRRHRATGRSGCGRGHGSDVADALEGHSLSVYAMAFSPDGKQLASASWDETVRPWDAATGAALQMLEGPSGSFNDDWYLAWAQGDTALAVVISPDGKQLASASWVRLWDVATGAALQTLKGHSDFIRTVAFSPDGKQLASASDDGTVRLWDAATGAALQTLGGHSLSAHAVAFSPDGKQLVSASYDKTVRLWKTATGAALQTLEVDGNVQALAFSSDGSCLEIDRGLLDLVSLGRGTVPSRPTLPRGVFVKEQWISRGMENLLWLPWDYRPSNTAVRGNVVVLGHASGRLTIIEFVF
ncbi:WD40 repeat-like protein [Zopfia rhizophila CBS 207.26]|uniref:WD40 repeat-like protein n=1 Tax=Zopfia rhizophila CBS 207.26 TaxID=1314779 RepID=A0A6A6EZ16_9PEZI|nr:WD40 repeat-like protein [Zopfia rhizophila CBS 207.26]